MWYQWVLLYIAGLIVGGVITSVIFIVKSCFGTFKIDRSNPEKDIYRLDIRDIDSISKKKRLIIKVDNKADLSQK